MKSKLLKGTLILTVAGFATRFLGFLYKLLLSNLLGSELLGVYQLVFPIYNICFTFYGSGIQTAISKIQLQKVMIIKITIILFQKILQLVVEM